MAVAQTFSHTNANLESGLPDFISAKDFMNLVSECGSPFFSPGSMRFWETRTNSVKVHKRTENGYLFSHRSLMNATEKGYYLVEATFTTKRRADGYYTLTVNLNTLGTFATRKELEKSI